MNRTERTLTIVAKQIEKDFLLIGLQISLEKFLTSEEYETFKLALKGILQDSCDKHWEVMDRIAKKIDKIADIAPTLEQRASDAMIRFDDKAYTIHPDDNEIIQKESLSSKPKFIGFESYTLDETIQKVNEFVSSDKCKHFISTEFKISQCAGINNLYVGIVTYQASDEDDSQ